MRTARPCPQELLVKVGKKLKKNNVSVDVVSFGACADDNREALEAFVAAVNKDQNSHFVEAPLGTNLCDFLLSSPVVSQAGAGGGGGEGGEGAAAGVQKCTMPADLGLVLPLQAGVPRYDADSGCRWWR